MDSEDAGTGLVARKEAAGGRLMDMAAVTQRTFHLHRLSLSEVATYQRIASEQGVDAELVTRLHLDPGTRDKALAEQEHAAGLGVHSYPTLLAHTTYGLAKIGSPVSSVQQLRNSTLRLHGDENSLRASECESEASRCFSGAGSPW